MAQSSPTAARYPDASNGDLTLAAEWLDVCAHELVILGFSGWIRLGVAGRRLNPDPSKYLRLPEYSSLRTTVSL